MTVELVKPYKPEHPVVPPPTREQARALLAKDGGAERWNDLMRRRNEAIRRSEQDPLNYGYELATWRLADVLLGFCGWEQFSQDSRVPDLWKSNEAIREMAGKIRFLQILGGNRSSKTTYIVLRCVQSVVRHNQAMTWLFHTDNDMSVTYHQNLAYGYLPPNWRKLKKSKAAYISFTQKNGFSDNKFVGPTRSQLEFRNYEQDVHKIEGGRLGDPQKNPAVGYASDELIPASWLETLEYRCSDFDARGLNAFTPIDGYTDAVAYYLDGAETVLSEPADVLADKGGKAPMVPLVQRHATRSDKAVVYFHSHYNPFADFENLVNLVSDKSMEEKRVRLFGVPSRTRQSKFPKLDRKVHGFKMDELPAGTRYKIVDPTDGRNWACAWVLVDAWGRYWFYREWPCPNEEIPGVGYPEPWAEPGSKPGHRHDGMPGKGQECFGFSLLEYKAEFARLEGWTDRDADMEHPANWNERNGARERIATRYMDPRFAAMPKATASRGTTLLEECAKIGLVFVPAPGIRIDQGVELINNRLAYKPGWEKPEDGPRMFIANHCSNLWYCLKTWTGGDGQKGATKDFVDLVRYGVTAHLSYQDPERVRTGQRVSDMSLYNQRNRR